MLLIYAPENSPRLVYTVDTLASALGLQPRLTSDFKTFENYNGPRLQYSDGEVSAGALQIVPAALLYEQDIHQQTTAIFHWRGLPAFFQTSTGEIPFDLFAAAFYLLSRYEEYLPHTKDTYGRFAHENSLAYRSDFLQLPLVNLWLQKLKQLLAERFPALVFSAKPFYFQPTYDIDIAWRYKGRGIARNVLAFLRSIPAGDLRELSMQVAVLSGVKKDPFDLFDWLSELHSRCSLQPLYFALLSKSRTGYDKNINRQDPAFRALLYRLSMIAKLGVHPSWQSGDQPALLEQERDLLSNITGKPVTISRQHYIRLSMPETYRKLLNAGVVDDYSMGYGSINGFRASYCLPFYWYDLERNTTTLLQVFPFCWMDANAYFEQNYTLQQAREELEHYNQITTSVDGQLITICHNHLLGNQQLFAGWSQMYEEFVTSHFETND